MSVGAVHFTASADRTIPQHVAAITNPATAGNAAISD